MTIAAPPGVFDIIPNDQNEPWHNSCYWQQVEEVIHQTAKDYGFQEIRTPLFERTELFQRSVGNETDIVSKEMYTFKDKGDRLLSLRPEGTASVLRAFIENQLQASSPIQKLYYIAPMFRYERSQAGRYRQHHQFGAEAIGQGSPYQDVEIIDLLYTLYNRLGLKNLTLNLNSVGSLESRKAYKTALCSYLKGFLPQLSAESQNRFEHNPLRILDSKDSKDQEILKNAPSILDHLDSESRDHFELVKQLLTHLNIPWVINSKLVRGLDYYNKTVFEITAEELGAQNSIGGGGRYDGLMKQLGGPDLPSIGFGTGLERIIQTMIKQQVFLRKPSSPTVYLIPLGDKAVEVSFGLLRTLRQADISASMDFSGRKLAKILQTADQLGAKFAVVIGEEEINSGIVELKELSSGEKTKAPLKNLAQILKLEEKSQQFLKLWSDLDKPFSEISEAEYFVSRLKSNINATKELASKLGEAADLLNKLL